VAACATIFPDSGEPSDCSAQPRQRCHDLARARRWKTYLVR
jgi:hypothetical protein